MPHVDERLERLLTEAAVEPNPTTDVLGAVAHKRRQRHTRRIARNVGALAAGLLVVAGSLVWLTANDSTEPAVAPSPVRVKELADAWLAARPFELEPDEGYVRGPLIASGEYVALATYDRDGTAIKIPPSRVVRIDENGRVLDEVELQGEILSLAEGEGARWVVTHDADNVANRLFRVKRIGADGAVASNALPVGAEPSGPIVAGGGAAWVPVSGGVLRFDAASGAYAEKIVLPGWVRPRLVRVGSDVYAYASPLDGKFVADPVDLLRLTPSARGPSIDVRMTVPVVAIVDTPTGPWALTLESGGTVVAPLDVTTGAVDRDRGVRLPARFTGTGLQAAGNTLWVTGGFANSEGGVMRIDVRKNGRTVAQPPVMLRAPNRSDLLGLEGNEVLVAAEGRLYRVNVGS
jgi:hypothetical protein